MITIFLQCELVSPISFFEGNSCTATTSSHLWQPQLWIAVLSRSTVVFLVRDGAGSNGRLYLIETAHRNTKQRSMKSLQTTSPCYSIAKSTLSVQLTFNQVEKTKHEISILFIFFFFFLTCIIRKYIVYANIIRTKQLLYYWASSFLVWVGVRATTGKLRLRDCLQGCIVFSFIDF